MKYNILKGRQKARALSMIIPITMLSNQDIVYPILRLSLVPSFEAFFVM